MSLVAPCGKETLCINEMSDLNQAKNLLSVAQRDLTALAGMLDTSVFADEIFGFHIQQAVEKLFKAWLAALGTVYPLTHNLDLLLLLLEDLGCDVSDYRELADFSPFAVKLRYVNTGTEDAPVNREQALTQVQILYEQVKTVTHSSD